MFVFCCVWFLCGFFLLRFIYIFFFGGVVCCYIFVCLFVSTQDNCDFNMMSWRHTFGTALCHHVYGRHLCCHWGMPVHLCLYLPWVWLSLCSFIPLVVFLFWKDRFFAILKSRITELRTNNSRVKLMYSMVATVYSIFAFLFFQPSYLLQAHSFPSVICYILQTQRH